MSSFVNTVLTTVALRAALIGVVKATAVLSLALLVAELLRRRRATDRYRVRVAGFVALLLVPPISAGLPSHVVPWLPSLPSSPMPIDGATPRTEQQSVAVATRPVETTGTIVAFDSTSGRMVALAVTALWLAGTICCLLPAIVSLAHRRALRRSARALDTPEWQHPVQRAARAVGFTGPVQLIRGKRGIAPMTWGAAPAIVILPDESETWSASCREAVLHHELAHAVRGDANMLLWCRAICAAYWFNPLVWFAFHRLRREQELAADELVLQTGQPGVQYVESLLLVLQGVRRARLLPGVAAAGQRTEMESRIRMILTEQQARPLPRSATTLLLIAVALVASVIAPISPAAQPRASFTRAPDTFRITYRLDGRDEEIALAGSVMRGDRLSTLQFDGDGRVVIDARTLSTADGADDRHLIITGNSSGIAAPMWSRGGQPTTLTDTDRAWIDRRLSYLVASLALRDQERLLWAARDSLATAGGLLPPHLSADERHKRVRAIEEISAQRLTTMRRREQLAVGGFAPWQLLDLDRKELALAWAELATAGVTHP